MEAGGQGAGVAVLSHTSKWHGQRCRSSCLSGSGGGPRACGPADRQQEGRFHPQLCVGEGGGCFPSHTSRALATPPSQLPGVGGGVLADRAGDRFLQPNGPPLRAVRDADGRKGHLTRTRSVPLSRINGGAGLDSHRQYSWGCLLLSKVTWDRPPEPTRGKPAPVRLTARPGK